MADIIRQNATLFAEAEVTEGTNPTPAAAQAVLARAISLKLQQDFHQRQYQGAYGYRDGVPGAQTGAGVSFEAEIKGDGSTNVCELDALLKACFGAVAAGTGSTTLTGGDSTTTNLHVSASANFTVGNGIMVETVAASGIYEATWIAAIVDANNITVDPPLSAGVTLSGANAVKEMRTYQIVLPPADVNSVTIEVWHNADAGASQADKFVGCHGNVKFDAPGAGEIPTLAFDFVAWAWSQVTNGTRPTPTYDVAVPKPGLSSLFKVGGTLTNIIRAGWDLGGKVTRKFTQNSTTGVYGTPHSNYTPNGSFEVHESNSSIAQFSAFQAGSVMSLSQQFGSALFGTVAWYAPRAQRRVVERAEDDGIGANDVQWDALIQNDGTPTSITSGPGALYLSVG